MAVTIAKADEGLKAVREAEAIAPAAGVNGGTAAESAESQAAEKAASAADLQEGTTGQAAASEGAKDTALELRRRIEQLQAERHKWLKENRKRLAERNQLRDQVRELKATRGRQENGSAESGEGAGPAEAPANGEPEQSRVEMLETKLEQLAQERDALSQALEQEKVRSALLAALAAAGARDPQIAYRAAEKSRLSVGENGAVSGIDEAVDELRQAIPELFEPRVPVNRLALGGRKPRRSDQKPVFTRGEIRQIVRSGRWAQLRPEILAAHRENRVVD